jgi:hypothetical protein
MNAGWHDENRIYRTEHTYITIRIHKHNNKNTYRIKQMHTKHTNINTMTKKPKKHEGI